MALITAIVGLTTAGCTAAGDIDNADANVALLLESIELVSSPWGDVLTSGGTILDDTANVTFSATLKAPISTDPLNTLPPLQNIALDRYEVTYTRTDGGIAAPPGFTRGIAGLVRLTEAGAEEVVEFTVNGIVIVPSTVKAQPPISFLVSPGTEPVTNFPDIQVNARVQFFGHTVSGDEVSVVAVIGVNFANYGDSNP